MVKEWSGFKVKFNNSETQADLLVNVDDLKSRHNQIHDSGSPTSSIWSVAPAGRASDQKYHNTRSSYIFLPIVLSTTVILTVTITITYLSIKYFLKHYKSVKRSVLGRFGCKHKKITRAHRAPNDGRIDQKICYR